MKGKGFVGTGLILVMTLLLSLVLVLFALLSFSAARGDLSLTNRMLELEQNYYAADREATLLLREFEASDYDFLSETIPMGELHALEVVFERQNGKAVVTAWNMIVLDDEAQGGEDFLPLWTFD